MFEQVVRDYSLFEQGESDTWNPLKSDYELAHRLSLFSCVTAGMRKCEIPIASLRILDIGCGTARSTRMYVDLGIPPEQLTGVDLRKGAIAAAAKSNPAINFRVIQTPKDACADGHCEYNWIQTSTVFSSIKDVSERESLANEISRILSVGGYLLYYDLVRANDFAGADLINPMRLFGQLHPVFSLSVNEWPYVVLLKALQEKADTAKRESFLGRMKRASRVMLNRERPDVTIPEICRKDAVLFRKRNDF